VRETGTQTPYVDWAATDRLRAENARLSNQMQSVKETLQQFSELNNLLAKELVALRRSRLLASPPRKPILYSPPRQMGNNLRPPTPSTICFTEPTPTQKSKATPYSWKNSLG
jgi:hypothetical protein